MRKVDFVVFWFLLLSIFAFSQESVRIHYHRQNSDYTNWGLYVWGTATGGTVQDWNEGPIIFDGNDDFGVYKDIEVTDSSSTFNFIVRSWNLKDGGDKTDIDGSHLEYWVIQGDEKVYKSNPYKKKEIVGTVRVHYNREDGQYSDWGLFIWGTATDGVVQDWGNGPIGFDGSDSYGVYKDVDIYDLNETFNVIVRTWNIKDGGDKTGLSGAVGNYWILEDDDTVYDYNPKKREIIGQVRIHYGRFDNDYSAVSMNVSGQAVDEQTLQYEGEDSFGVYNDIPVYSLSETFAVEVLKNGIVDSGQKTGLNGNVGEYWVLEGYETIFDYEPEKKKQVKGVVKFNYFREDALYTNWDLIATGGAIDGEGIYTFDQTNSYGSFTEVKVYDLSATFNIELKNGDLVDGTLKTNIDPNVEEYWLIEDDNTVYDYNPRQTKDYVRIHYYREDNSYDNWGLFVWGDAVGGAIQEWNEGPILFTGSDSYGAYIDLEMVDTSEVFNIITRTSSIKDGGDKKGLRGDVSDYWFLEGDDTVYDYNPRKKEIVGQVRIHYGRFDDDYSNTELKVNGEAVDGNKSFTSFDGEDTYGIYKDVDVYSLSKSFTAEVFNNSISDEGLKSGLTGSGAEYWILEGYNELFTSEPEKKKQVKGIVKINYYREDALYNNWELQAWGDALDIEVIKSFEGSNDYGVYSEINIYDLTKTFDLQIRSGLTIDGEKKTNIDSNTKEYWLIENDNTVYDYNPRQEKDFVRIHYYRSDNSYNNWGLFVWGVATNGVVQDWANGPIHFEGTDEYGAYIDIEIYDTSETFNIITRTSSIKDGGDKKGLKGDVSDYWFLEGDDTLYDYNPRKKEIVGQVRIHYGRFDDDYSNTLLKVSGEAVDGDQEVSVFEGNDSFGVYTDIDVYSLTKEFSAKITNNDVLDEGIKTGLTGNGQEYWLLEGYSELFTTEPEKKKKEKNFTRIHYNRNDNSYENWGLFVWGDAIGGVINEWHEGPVYFEGTDDYGAYVDLEIVDTSKTFNILMRTTSIKDAGDKKGLEGSVKNYWFLENDNTIYDYNPLKKYKVGEVKVHYGRVDNDYSDYRIVVSGDALDGNVEYTIADGEDEFGIYNIVDIYDLEGTFDVQVFANGVLDGGNKTGYQGSTSDYWILEEDDTIYDYIPKKKVVKNTVRVHYGRVFAGYEGYSLEVDGEATFGKVYFHSYDGEDEFGVYNDIDIYDETQTFDLIVRLNNEIDGDIKLDMFGGASEYWLLEKENTIYDTKPTKKQVTNTVRIHYKNETKEYSGFSIKVTGEATFGERVYETYDGIDNFGAYKDIDIYETLKTFDAQIMINGNNESGVKTPFKGDAERYWLLEGDDTIYEEDPSNYAKVKVHYHRDDNSYEQWGLYVFGDAVGGELQPWEDGPIYFDNTDSFGVYKEFLVKWKDEQLNFSVRNDEIKDGGDYLDVDANKKEFWVYEQQIYDYEPEIIVKPDKIRIHYHRFDNSYHGWGAHVWGDAYGGEEMFWDKGPKYFDKSDDFGMYMEFPIDKTGDTIKIVARNDYGGIGHYKDGETKVIEKVSQEDYWILEGLEEVYTYKPSTANQFLTAKFVSKGHIQGYLSGTSGVNIYDIKLETTDGESININNVYQNGTDVNMYFDDVDLNKNYYLLVNGAYYYPRYTKEVLNDYFFYDGDDLGANLVENENVQIKLWSPTAQKVKVNIYGEDGVSKVDSGYLTRGEKGVWEIVLDKLETYSGLFYDYEVTAFNKTKRGFDPYSKSMKGMGLLDKSVYKSAIIDFGKTKTVNKIKNSDIMKSKNDIVIYELHIRDFTINENSGVEESLRGTYRGLIEKIDYLKDLGITHIELMPVQNFGAKDEYDKSFKSIPDTYSWGYNTTNFLSLAGWYSEDPYNPYSRIEEFKDMVNAFHEAGIGIILDVVYNHTDSTEVFDNIAPKSYYRFRNDGSIVQGAEVGPMPETRTYQVRKLMIDTLKIFKEEYGVDGFRFDSMAHIDIETMKQVRSELGEDAILTSEAWTTDIGYEGASIANEFYPQEEEISGWAITARNGILNNTSYVADGSELGFIQKNIGQFHQAKAAVIGNIKDYYDDGTVETNVYDRFAEEPTNTMAYVSAHDGFALWDKINLTINGDKWLRARYAKFAYSMLFTSQGRLMINAGDEFGRIKPLPSTGAVDANKASTWNFNNEGFGTEVLRNSYNHGDYSNMVRWERLEDGVFEGLKNYVKALINMRRTIPAFRYETTDNILRGLKFIHTSSPHYRDYAGHRTFDSVDSLKIEFYNAPWGSRNRNLYFIGEVYMDDPFREHNDFHYSVHINNDGYGEITFNKDQISKFDLHNWYNIQDLNFVLTERAGDITGKISSYSGGGNNRIDPFKIESGNRIGVDLGITNHMPNTFSKHYPDQVVMAYELDNTIEANDSGIERLVVVHNAEDYAVEVHSDLITNTSDWKVILDDDEVSLDGVSYTDVSIQYKKVVVPGKSSAVIAR